MEKTESRATGLSLKDWIESLDSAQAIACTEYLLDYDLAKLGTPDAPFEAMEYATLYESVDYAFELSQ